MALNAQYRTGTFTRQTAALKTQSIVEIKFSGQDTGDVLAAYPQISLNSCEVSSGRLTYGGRLVCTLVYADGGGKLCRIQKGAEFSHFLDEDSLAPSQRGDCVLRCERTQIKRDGSSYVVAVVVGAEIAVFDSAQRNYITDIEGAICNREERKLYTVIGFSGESEVEDDFDCVAADVLIPAADVLVTDCTARGGVAEISGEIYLSLLAVRGSSPVCLDRTVPFKCELACDEAVLSRRAFCRAEIKEASVNCRVNEDKGTCEISFSSTLSFSGRFFGEETAVVVSDAFCPDSELSLTFSEERAGLYTDIKVYSERVSGLAAAKARLDYTCAFLAAALPRAEFTRSAEGIEGSVTATLLYEQGGEVRATEVNLPFAVTLAGLSADCSDISVAVSGMSLRQRAEGECEAEATLRISAADGSVSAVRYVTEAAEGESRAQPASAISVYIPAAGDGIWETAKRLLESPENIQRSNPDLKFPLTGKERILIYRPKKA